MHRDAISGPLRGPEMSSNRCWYKGSPPCKIGLNEFLAHNNTIYDSFRVDLVTYWVHGRPIL